MPSVSTLPVSVESPEKVIARLERRLVRANEGRRQAELILDRKSSEIYQINAELAHERDFLKISLGALSEGVLCIDNDSRVVYVNHSALGLLQLAEEDAIGEKLRTVLRMRFPDESDHSVSPYRHASKKKGRALAFIVGKKGKTSTVEVIHKQISKTDDGVKSIIIFHDITKIQEMTGRIAHAAKFDQVTSLPNLEHFSSLLRSKLSSPEQKDRGLALYSVDLNGFRRVIDSKGYQQSDEILATGAKLSRATLRQCDIMGRVSVDEFMIAIDGIRCKKEALKIGEHIRALIKGFRFDQFPDVTLTASVGVAVYPDHSMDSEVLMRASHVAMKEAKRDGNSDCQLLDDEIMQRTLRNVKIERLLPVALASDELTLHYQPKWDIETKKVNGAEALIRWNNKELGFVSPLEVIEVAEATGLIVSLGWWVLNRACETILAWSALGYDIPIAVNVSAKQLLRDDFVPRFEAIVSQLEDKMHLLSIELTETAVIHNTHQTSDIFSRMADLGIKVAVDDFGIGYSSLSYVQSLHFSELKIDKAFVDKMCDNKASFAIVNAIVVMAKGLGLNVVAEGIEHNYQREMLAGLGCDQGQGYLLSPAIASGKFIELLSQDGVNEK